MFQHALKIAFRNLIKRKSITFIHLFGLTLGIAVFLIIVQYVQFEKSYDWFFSKANQIYRMDINFFKDGVELDKDAMNYPATGPAMVRELPEVISFVRITPEYGQIIFRHKNELYEETKVFYADSNMFQIFDYKLLEGDPNEVLKGLNKIVITESLAEKYFGNRNDWLQSPVGQLLNFNNQQDFIVSGIVEDPPENTHLKFNALISFETFASKNQDLENIWTWNDFYTYILTTSETTQPLLQSKLIDFVERHKGKNSGNQFYAQPLTGIHLYAHQSDEPETNGDGTMINALLIIAVVILLVAWINYINLSTARSQERSREVGIRKVSGANPGLLIVQFLGEAFLLNLFSMVLSLVIAFFAISYLGNILGKSLHFDLIYLPVFWMGVLVLILTGTLFSGLYPAFVLSSFSPKNILKGVNKKPGEKNLLRKGLIIFQFVTAITLIIGTLVIYNQVYYMQTKNLGFDMKNKMIINTPGVYKNDSIFANKFSSFKNEVIQIAGVNKVSMSSAVPGGNLEYEVNVNGLRLEGKEDGEYRRFWIYFSDHEFIDTYDMRLIAGKGFSSIVRNDLKEMIINKSGARVLGYDNPDDIIGESVQHYFGKIEVVGVVDDYHHQSVKNGYLPMALLHLNRNTRFYTLNLDTSQKNNINKVTEQIKTAWFKIYPDNPFTYTFLDDRYNFQYKSDVQMGKVFFSFALFAVLITCLGLIGLSSYMVITRTKEIGIRKVLGASVKQIVYILSKDFILLLAVSTLLAVPIGYHLFDQWLQGFAWHVNISFWLLGIPVILVCLLSLATVSGFSLKAANINPVDSLRNE